MSADAFSNAETIFLTSNSASLVWLNSSSMLLMVELPYVDIWKIRGRPRFSTHRKMPRSCSRPQDQSLFKKNCGLSPVYARFTLVVEKASFLLHVRFAHRIALDETGFVKKDYEFFLLSAGRGAKQVNDWNIRDCIGRDVCELICCNF